ncbi:hypothetical protein [Streptomyces sp. NPDC004546]|uniref:hypothetical protein n=1 Tax=unclassified Streptomyces TaxID=2593676 RepID=UPI0033A39D2A
MPRDPDEYSDLAAAGVSLAAEAALLEAHLRMLQEAIDSVDERITVVTETLHRLRPHGRPAPKPRTAGNTADHPAERTPEGR